MDRNRARSESASDDHRHGVSPLWLVAGAVVLFLLLSACKPAWAVSKAIARQIF